MQYALPAVSAETVRITIPFLQIIAMMYSSSQSARQPYCSFNQMSIENSVTGSPAVHRESPSHRSPLYPLTMTLSPDFRIYEKTRISPGLIQHTLNWKRISGNATSFLRLIHLPVTLQDSLQVLFVFLPSRLPVQRSEFLLRHR